MTVRVEGVDQVLKNLEALKGHYGKAIANALVASGNDVRNTAIRAIQEDSVGSVVTRTRAGGNTYQHIASAAGDAPNTDTGRLVGSVQVEIEPSAVLVGSTLEYAGMLEFGTARMQPRPWLNPSMEANRRKIEQRFARAVNQVSDERGDV